MTTLEQQILDTIQDAFPLEERPYQVLADLFNEQGSVGVVTERQVFDAVEGLRNSGVIRRIGGIYDSRRLGFISRLCAGKVTDVDGFAAMVNEIPAITHNYVRSHEFNVWFTVIAENEAEVQKVIDSLCSRSDLHDVHVLSVTKKFKINTVMMSGIGDSGSVAGMTLRREPPKENVVARNVVPKQSIEERHPEPFDKLRVNSTKVKSLAPNDNQNSALAPRGKDLSQSDRDRIRVACSDIPHTLTPYADWGVSVEELRNDIADGYMRRFGAILRHQQAGFAYNAMVCFDAPAAVGAVLAENPHVSHCYERPAFEGFPYNLYAMMHAQSAEDLECFIKDAAQSIGNPDYAVLHSVKELKKTSFPFFA